MKRQYFYFLLLISQLGFCQSEPTIEIDKLIIGKWAGIDNYGNSNVMILEEGNYVTFATKDKTYGREFDVNGRSYIYKYIINTGKSPIQIDFIIFRKETNKEEKHYRSIIRFIDNNTLEMRTNKKSSKYPKKFVGKKDDNTLILKRVQN